jgi:hypothetical protein
MYFEISQGDVTASPFLSTEAPAIVDLFIFSFVHINCISLYIKFDTGR